ncbi:MAG: hypothetical protein LBP59_08955 [Planctomycetaceae bacterium]|nr:hypothetical protein [Planctomycetaceae bacterium]
MQSVSYAKFPKIGFNCVNDLMSARRGVSFFWILEKILFLSAWAIYCSYLNFIDLKASKPAVRKLGGRR